MTMCSNPETNSDLCRMHSDFFLSSSDFHPHRLGGTGRHSHGWEEISAHPNTCAGKGPDLERSAVHAVRIANPQQGFDKEEDMVELDLSDFFLLEI